MSATFTNYTSSDYNGFSPNPASPYQFEWNSPPFDVVADYKDKPVVRRYKSFREYSEATGQDRHSILIGYDSFMSVMMPNSPDLRTLYNPEDYDFRLKQGSPAIAAGMVLPTITDGFKGKSPDLGAYQSGLPLPHYGPRVEVVGQFPVEDTQFRSWNGPPHTPGEPGR